MRTILGNWVAGRGFDLALEKISAGSNGLDLIEATLNAVELDPKVPHVGVGGMPNALGIMQFDGAVMDGKTGAVGAVAALTVTPRAVSVARAILKFGLHTFLVGEGADRFSRECGISDVTLLSDEMKAGYDQWNEKSFGGASPHSINLHEKLPELFGLPPHEEKDTAVMIVMDRDGNISVGTSTSGWGFKYPGRVGDSPIAGGGYFARNGVGAAVCTHTGENSMRTAAAATVVRAMQFGLSLEDALRFTAKEVLLLSQGTLGPLVLHGMDKNGEVAALGVRFDPGAEPVDYCVWHDGMTTYQSLAVPNYLD